MTDAALVERLARHQTVGAAPRDQLEWLVSHGRLRRLTAGEVMFKTGDQIDSLFVVLSGHLSIRVDRGAGPRKVMEWRGGDVTGFLPYSRMAVSPGASSAEEASEILMVDRKHFPELIGRCHELTAILVHVMLDRARRFTRSDLHDEKMRSLGRLAAGLAHELNNPASAVARSAKELSSRLLELEETSVALGARRLTPEQHAAISEARERCEQSGSEVSLSPLERADREEAVAAWLDGRGLGDDIAEALSESALVVECLEPLAGLLDHEALELALRSIGAGHRARKLAAEVETAAGRVHGLVAAIKGFTYMDQSEVRKPVAIGQGLADTMAVLGAKARGKSVTVTVRVPGDLPVVDGFGGELNQVWVNLIDNAIDAASRRVEVSASARDEVVVVRVVDDGPGIPEETRERIFEPFFTTKPQGEGTGLGLDIARRLVHEHDGQVEVESEPGRTEFRVTLPRA
ncbi:MAG: GHKL domain-containing protein [Candidatus Latescibacterota bacterium]|nr:MAG: GHKL domain-containing protein [Candidatus Latescibacterota bacterium]